MFAAVAGMVALLAGAAAQPVSNAVASFQTLGSAFSPAVYFNGAPPDSYQWVWSDGASDSNQPFANKDFGSPGARMQTLAVDPVGALTAINLGFDGSDGGWTTNFVNRDNQQVSKVTFVKPLTNLQLWASSYNPITNTLDFSGFLNLQDIECFHCSNLQHVVVSSLPSLRRLCFEDCQLRELDISNNPNLEDMRSALNSLTSVKIGGGTGPKIWHWCFRDNPQITQHFQSIMTNFYSLQELWIWNANQSGALTFVSTNLTDVEVHHNAYTSADFRGQTNLTICQVNDNRLTSLVLNGCRSLDSLEAQNNQLSTAALDQILATLDNPDFAIRSVNLAGNPKFASAAGLRHYTNLTERGVFVNLDWPNPNPPKKIVVKIQSSPAGRSLSVDGQKFAGAKTFSWTPGSEHVIATDTPQNDSAGRLFDWQSWSDGGDISHSVAPASNATFTAIFSNPFSPFAGSYSGLFWQSNNIQHASSGSLNLLLTDRRTFTGAVWLAGKRYSISGQLAPDGNVVVNLPAGGSGNSISVSLSLSMTPDADTIVGSVSNGNWLASLEAVRAGFNGKSNPATNYSGAYTIVFPASASGSGLPGGNGYGTMKVDTSGKVMVKGTLSEASPYTFTVRASAAGEFPVYLSLYGSKGSLLGWMQLSNQPMSDLDGILSWIKPATASKVYPGGFTNVDQVCFGSRYQPPAVQSRALNITNGLAGFSGGNLSAPFTNLLAWAADNKVTNLSTNKLTLSIASPTGAFSGTVHPAGSSATVPFKGVLVQKQNVGLGVFSGTTETGGVLLQNATE